MSDHHASLPGTVQDLPHRSAIVMIVLSCRDVRRGPDRRSRSLALRAPSRSRVPRHPRSPCRPTPHLRLGTPATRGRFSRAPPLGPLATPPHGRSRRLLRTASRDSFARPPRGSSARPSRDSFARPFSPAPPPGLLAAPPHGPLATRSPRGVPLRAAPPYPVITVAPAASATRAVARHPYHGDLPA